MVRLTLVLGETGSGNGCAKLRLGTGTFTLMAWALAAVGRSAARLFFIVQLLTRFARVAV